MEFRGWKFLAVLLPRIPFLEFKGFAGFPLSAQKFPRWSFLGGTSWLAILSFSLFWEPNPRWNFLGGASWQLGVDLVKTWRMWSYLARNCRNLSSSARLIWVEFPGWKFLAVSWLAIPCFPLSCRIICYIGEISWVGNSLLFFFLG